MELYQSAAPWLRILGMNALNRVGAKLKKTWFLVQFHLRFPKTVGGGGGKCLPTSYGYYHTERHKDLLFFKRFQIGSRKMIVKVLIYFIFISDNSRLYTVQSNRWAK